MDRLLVGSTGLVGQNLISSVDFDLAVHSTDINKAFEGSYSLAVYAGVPGTKFLANRNPESDLEIVKMARENLRKINASKTVLISTVDVYGDSRQKTEEDAVGGEGLTRYGENRMLLEQWVREDNPDATIVRLPAIYGKGLKKNFIYDILHPVPRILDEKRLFEIATQSKQIADLYVNDRNGFFSLREDANMEFLENWFASNAFNALSFTDSRAEYQFYNLGRLWNDINIALEGDVRIINIATPPLSAACVYKSMVGKKWTNRIDKPVVKYNMRTVHSGLWGRSDGYILSEEDVLADLTKYIDR